MWAVVRRRDRARATAVLEVVHTGSAVVARQHDSVVLQHTSKVGFRPFVRNILTTSLEATCIGIALNLLANLPWSLPCPSHHQQKPPPSPPSLFLISIL